MTKQQRRAPMNSCNGGIGMFESNIRSEKPSYHYSKVFPPPTAGKGSPTDAQKAMHESRNRIWESCARRALENAPPPVDDALTPAEGS